MELKKVNLNLDFNFEEQYSISSVLETKQELDKLNNSLGSYIEQLVLSKVRDFDDIDDILTKESKKVLNSLFKKEIINSWISDYEHKIEYLKKSIEYDEKEQSNIDTFISSLRHKEPKMLCFLLISIYNLYYNYKSHDKYYNNARPKSKYAYDNFGWLCYNDLKILNAYHINDFISNLNDFTKKLIDKESNFFNHFFLPTKYVPCTKFSISEDYNKNMNFTIFVGDIHKINYNTKSTKDNLNYTLNYLFRTPYRVNILSEITFQLNEDNTLADFNNLVEIN